MPVEPVASRFDGTKVLPAMGKRIFVTGASGNLGALCVARFGARADIGVVALRRPGLDLEDEGSIGRSLAGLSPGDVVLNCAAWTDVDACESDPDRAHRINGRAVGFIGQLAVSRGARVVHISTDYVFSGEQHSPYREGDSPAPINTYGRSKLAGEEALLGTGPDHLVVRLSWLFGTGSGGFPSWVVRQALASEDLSVVSDKWGSPTHAADAAVTLERLILGETSCTGVVHVCNTGQASWLEWGQFTLDRATEAGIPLRTTRLDSITMAELATKAGWKARRPVHSALVTDRLAALTGLPLRGWREAVAEYVREDLAREILRAPEPKPEQV